MTATVPTVDHIAADPASAGNLPERTLKALLAKCLVVQGALATRLLDKSSAGTDVGIEEQMNQPFADAKEMARLLRVHESWVRSEQRHGRIPFVRVGRYVRFRPADVERALEDRNQR
jgi:excisionase family DNA binding protein